MALRSLLVTFASLSTLITVVHAAPTSDELDPRLSLTPAYAPIPAACPNISLVRNASGISADEAAYYNARKPVADKNLAAWLSKQGNFSTSAQPSVAFTGSGGGLRALLESAGVVQAFDARDSNASIAGVYQALTYEAGLSGGAWFLSSFAGNNWPTISSLRDDLWQPAFQNSVLLPRNLLQADEYVEVTNSLLTKLLAGFELTLIDVYGRLLSYQFLYGDAAGDDIRLSTLTTFSNFTSHNVPYPIMTTLGVDNSYQGGCYPGLNATQYEFHPYEYGSWDAGVDAFARTQYMGSDITNGQPTKAGKCVQHYDNIGYVFGTSSDVFASDELLGGLCAAPPTPSNSTDADTENVLEAILTDLTGQPAFTDVFGIYPNPFYQLPRSAAVNQNKLLTMADGGLSDQNVPIWPFIQPGRNVDVLIAGDNSADTDGNLPNGTEPRQTYINAQYAGLTKMPYIPDVDTFVAQGLNKRATFFGCNSTESIFIVYLPNVNYTFPSGQSTFRLEYSVQDTDGMIANGNAIATQNGDPDWPFCLACAIKNKDTDLPDECNACFQKHCYYRSGTTA